MHDILAKKIGSNEMSWDLHINQMLGAIRFNVSETTKFSPFFLLYNRDVVLPLDNILRPHRLNYSKENHQIQLQEMHRTFTMVRNNTMKAKRRAIERSRKRTKEVEFEVGDLVYYKNHQRTGKLDRRWTPHYIVIEKTGPVSYKIKEQLSGSVTKAHAEHLRAAHLEEWEEHNTETPLQMKSVPTNADRDTSASESDDDPADYPTEKCRRQREDPTNESNVPVMERQIMTRQRAREMGIQV